MTLVKLLYIIFGLLYTPQQIPIAGHGNQVHGGGSTCTDTLELVTAWTGGSTRHNFTGDIGMTFILDTSLTVTCLGVFVNPGNTLNHVLYLTAFNGPPPTLLASTAAINFTTCTQDGKGFCYASVTPVSISSTLAYYISCSEVTDNGDIWDDSIGSSVTFSGIGHGAQDRYSPGAVGPAPPTDIILAGSGDAFVGVSLKGH